MKLVGYYRVPPVKGIFFSPAQEERLLLLGCAEVFSDRCLASGVVRPGLARALDALEDGGALAVPTFHALGGDMAGLVDAVLKIHARGLNLIVQQPGIDTRTDPGFFETCQMLAGFSRERPMVRAAETALVAKGAKAGGMKGLKAEAPPPPEED
ncbi:recombinase family protein [Caulobacter sp. RL271]|jgi:DNA invertase Pin-like site-specific DNA recombinase|uniref:Recombinase family protein n=1 Tax=Caulobacter segnis TaxID=88688 RepID=A0ABY4ZUY9_9CAUL|nr:recombinase family protein [Caulobacter segnis]USQ96424.1 recombinase family protein [Caulobacter segnis]